MPLVHALALPMNASFAATIAGLCTGVQPPAVVLPASAMMNTGTENRRQKPRRWWLPRRTPSATAECSCGRVRRFVSVSPIDGSCACLWEVKGVTEGETRNKADYRCKRAELAH